MSSIINTHLILIKKNIFFQKKKFLFIEIPMEQNMKNHFKFSIVISRFLPSSLVRNLMENVFNDFNIFYFSKLLLCIFIKIKTNGLIANFIVNQHQRLKILLCSFLPVLLLFLLLLLIYKHLNI